MTAIDERPADAPARANLPRHGHSRAEVSHMLADVAEDDVRNWEAKLMAGGTYPAGDDVMEVAKEAYLAFFSTNPLYTSVFKSLVQMEREIIEMTAGLHHGTTATGSVTSGGTESILMGVKIARDRARALHPEITKPEMIVPFSAHPAFTKGAQYFDLKVVEAPLRPDLNLDVDAYKALITDNTVLMVGSAPSFTLGQVDPIGELAPLALERNINFHVDSCIGGFFLPFVEKLGYDLPVFDFRIPGVTTISADLHKFGYTAKGASTILSRDPDIFSYQVFKFGKPPRPSDWYVTPSMTGTRPGGAIAAAWAVLQYLGEDGYLRLVGNAMRYIRRFFDGIEAIPGLKVMGKPAMTVFGYTSVDPQLDIFAIADGLEARNWLVSLDEFPANAIRFMQSPGHEPYIDAYLKDLREVADLVRRGDITSKGGRAQYS